MTVIGVLSLIFGAFSFWAYRSVLDGSPSMYQKLRGRAIMFTLTGAGLIVIGVLLLIARKFLR